MASLAVLQSSYPCPIFPQQYKICIYSPAARYKILWFIIICDSVN